MFLEAIAITVARALAGVAVGGASVIASHTDVAAVAVLAAAGAAAAVAVADAASPFLCLFLLGRLGSVCCRFCFCCCWSGAHAADSALLLRMFANCCSLSM